MSSLDALPRSIIISWFNEDLTIAVRANHGTLLDARGILTRFGCYKGVYLTVLSGLLWNSIEGTAGPLLLTWP